MKPSVVAESDKWEERGGGMGDQSGNIPQRQPSARGLKAGIASSQPLEQIHVQILGRPDALSDQLLPSLSRNCLLGAGQMCHDCSVNDTVRSYQNQG